ncbi:MAG TPA: AsmA-like C-terminal region-containing protein, partial [Hyphomicrobiaceae bacterium]|nr:AsmA-like C-terminal region-containing protein [Hyphomicrobiaceae bacterium]
RKKISGKLDARLDLRLPFLRRLGGPLPKPSLTGQVRVLDGSARGLVAGKDISGAAILIDIADKSVDARGKLLVNGVPANLSWQHILGAEPARQPPLRVTATLDNADRKALGMEINHVVQGEIGILLTWSPQNLNSGTGHVRADLTKADITFDSLAWHKPAGRQAILEMDVTPAADGKSKKLEKIRMAGEGIAIEGSAVIGGDQEIKSFDLPLFSINVVTRLELKGQRGKNNIWNVTVRGQAYEGRDMFRALFSAGQLTKKAPDQKPSHLGVDLDARVSSVLGFWNTSMKDVVLELSKRRGNIVALAAHGTLEGGRKLIVQVQKTPPGQPRQLIAMAGDAGAAFQLVGFYPNAQRGRMQLVVNLDGAGAAEKTGLLYVEDFQVLGDPVVNEVIYAPEDGGATRQRKARRRSTRQVMAFDWMRVPFSVGYGQFVMNDAELRGPVLGAVLRGKADFNSRSLNLGGTYVPLQGLNAALGAIPGLGQLIAGPRGEGILGVTFAVQGPMNDPQILVNPLSLVAPGIFREMFQMTNPSPRVTPGAGAPEKHRRQKSPAVSDGWRARTFQQGGGN